MCVVIVVLLMDTDAFGRVPTVFKTEIPLSRSRSVGTDKFIDLTQIPIAIYKCGMLPIPSCSLEVSSRSHML